LSGRVTAAVGDLTTGSLPAELSGSAADICTLMFVLSAIAPGMFAAAIRTLSSGLRDGGIVLLRDYALGDGAQTRLEGRRDPKRLDASAAWMVRQDGTLAYYFSIEEVTALFDAGGFDTLQCEVAHRTTTNRTKGLTLARRFITARFRKRPNVAA
jgi:methyltransferase-like protein 6